MFFHSVTTSDIQTGFQLENMSYKQVQLSTMRAVGMFWISFFKIRPEPDSYPQIQSELELDLTENYLHNWFSTIRAK